jgi:acyl-coenzyme A thioesterase PaaI-like protein
VLGGELRIEARVLHRGRSSAYVEATFSDADGEMVAKASATQTIRRPEAG